MQEHHDLTLVAQFWYPPHESLAAVYLKYKTRIMCYSIYESLAAIYLKYEISIIFYSIYE